MNVRYYLRGLGVGILVTAVILGVTGEGELTDAEIKIRAARLGMVEEAGGVLSELPSQTGEEGEASAQVDPTLETASAEGIPGEEEALPVTEEEQDVLQYVLVTVEKGNGSETVSQKLYDAGMISSVKEFDKYLIEGGFDRKIRVGEYRIPIDASEEEMARILCGLD